MANLSGDQSRQSRACARGSVRSSPVLSRRPSIFSLLWSPGSLARVAATAPRWQVMLVAPLGAMVASGLVVAASMGTFGEPYATLREYYIQGVLIGFLRCSTFMLLPLSLIVTTVLVFVPSRTPRTSWESAWMRAAALVPMAVLLPIVLWSALRSMAALSDPNVQIVSGVPAWMTSVVIRMGGSFIWLPVGVAIAIVIYVRAGKQLDLMLLKEPVCLGCGYDLTGISRGRCPECGAATKAGRKSA